MKPGFALSLSFEGINLLYRGGAGWRRIGDVRIDDPDLTTAVGGLRRSALNLAQPGTGVFCKLVLPNDQIRYMSIETGAVDLPTRRAAARAALDGATPYAVEDLSFDIAADGAVTHVAAVARDTLAEAEAFAVEHRFDPVSFVAIPNAADFVGEPFFGLTDHASKALPPGETVDRDGGAMEILSSDVDPQGPGGDAADDDAPASAQMSEFATPGGADNAGSPRGMAEPAAGFASRRRKPDARPSSADDAPAKRTPTIERTSSATVIAIPAAQPTAPRPSRPAPTVAPVARSGGSAPARQLAPDVTPVPQQIAPSQNRAPAGAPLRATATAAVPDTAEPRAGFISRRRTAPVPVEPRVNPTPDTPPADKKPRRRGSPGVLALILTLVLLLILAAVGALAGMIREDGLAGLFRRAAPVQTEAPTVVSPPDIAAIDPRILAIPAETIPAPRETTTPPTEPALSPPQGPTDITTDLPALAPPAAPASSGAQIGSTPDGAIALIARPPVPQGPTQQDEAADTAALDALRDQTGQTAVDPEEIADAPLPAAPPITAFGGEASYAATGIWTAAPDVPDTPRVISLDDLYVAAIDGATLTQDALALPTTASYDTDISLNGVASPAAAGIAFELDALGLVDPSPEGTVTPDGIVVFLGRPPVVPPPTPNRIESIAQPVPLVPDIPRTRPRGRPTDLVENTERQRLGGLTLVELGGVRPRARPAQPEAETASPDAAPDPAVDAPALSPADQRLASVKPKARPRDFAQTVIRAQQVAQPTQQTANTPSAGPAAAASTASTANLAAPVTSNRSAAAPAVPNSQAARPTGPTPTSVAKQATIKNAINLRQVNLIGVYGTPSNRRALVRLSTGRYKKVKVGDRIDGGRIVAIGDTELRYQKSGRNVVLRMPRG